MHARSIFRGALLRWVLTVTVCAALSACLGDATMPANSPVADSSGAAVATGGTPAAVLKAEQADTAVDPAIVAADNGFGLNLLNQLIGANTGNVAISPVSIALALQILDNGAAGTTRTVLGQTLNLGSLSLSGINNDNAALQASLLTADPDVQLTIANSLWMHLSENPVLPSFSTADQTYYGATIGDLAGAPDNVNA